MLPVDDRIQAGLMAEIDEQLQMAEARRNNLRLMDKGIRLTNRELAQIKAISGDFNIQLYCIYRIHSGDWLMVRHPELIDIYYTLDGRCPHCKTDILRRTQTPAGTRYDCALCELGVECWDYQGE